MSLLFFVQSGVMELSVRTSVRFVFSAPSMGLPSSSFGVSSISKLILIG